MKLPYSEATIFLVPLPSGGYARGVVARVAPRGGIVLGYFFDPRLFASEEAGMEGLRPSGAVLVMRFGDLGLVRREWPVLGCVEAWSRSEWPTPAFVRRDPLGRLRPRRFVYADDDPSREIGAGIIDDDAGLLPDTLAGYRALSILLDATLE